MVTELKIIGLELVGIQKQRSKIDLIFKDRKSQKRFELGYRGFLFETPNPVLNKKVRRAEISETVGFKALTQLRLQGLQPSPYKQLFIEMEGSTGEHKIELICVSMNFHFKSVRSTQKVN